MSWNNDARGWLLTALGAVACMFGACIICVDVIVRQFPSHRNWRIQDSSRFMSTSLSLSFGVMMFSSLYNMLPSSKESLIAGGYSCRDAAWILIACFIGGVIAIDILSRAVHRFIPHDVAGCEHSHRSNIDNKEAGGAHEHNHNHRYDDQYHGRVLEIASEIRPAQVSQCHRDDRQRSKLLGDDQDCSPGDTVVKATSKVPAQIAGNTCDWTTGDDPSCRGNDSFYGNRITETTPLLPNVQGATHTRPQIMGRSVGVFGRKEDSDPDLEQGPSYSSSTTAVPTNGAASSSSKTTAHTSHQHSRHESCSPDLQHSHIPTDKFLSIGLQTSIAIALHKLPEGFITYATNHANPTLGFSVFLALFIHNITEGFALALPLFLALSSRYKAILISFVLGGLFQPLGAGIAAVWFHLAGSSAWAPSEAGNGIMFAITAGIMTNVALQLFNEALELTPSKYLCMVGAFVGMSILGVSSALTA